MKLAPRHKNYGWTCVFALVFLSLSVQAQDNFRFERISVNDGLSQADVRAMVQDHLGFLWIGTRDGLNRYDGMEFRHYAKVNGDSTSLYFNQIWDLVTDSVGNIWIASVGGISLYRYQVDQFENFLFPDEAWRDTNVHNLVIQGPGEVLLSTSKGVVHFDLRDKTFKVRPGFQDLEGRNILFTAESKDHGVWVGTEGDGVFIRKFETAAWTRLLTDQSIQHIYFDSNSKVYLSTRSGLFVHDFKAGLTTKLEVPHEGGIASTLRMSNGDLWIAANEVILLNEKDELKVLLERDKFNQYSLSENRARVLYQTSDDVIWVGTWGYGVNKFNPDMADFNYLSEQSPLPLSGNYVSAVFTKDDTTVLVGTARGLDQINLHTKSVQHFTKDDDLFQIFKIDSDRKQNIWAATSHGFMQYKGGRLISVNDELRSVYDFAEWDDVHLVLAHRSRGIYLFNRLTGVTTEFISKNYLPEEVATLMVENDHLWIGSRDGLKLFNRNGKLKKHFTANVNDSRSLPASFVKALYRDTRRNLWVGTWGGGLGKFDPRDSTFKAYSTVDGLPSNVVYGIIEDYSGVLWLSTNYGLSAFNPRRNTFRNFDFFDGLQGNEFNTGAYFKSANGLLYFGGIDGLSFFDPETVLKNHSVSTVLTTAINLSNQSVQLNDNDSFENVLLMENVTSSWQKNDIGIEFTAVDFKHANKYDFQYSIRDTIWHSIGNRRSLELVDLPSGRHQIKVRAKKPGADWSEDIVLLGIEIIPPFWQRTWFRLAAVLLSIALALGFYRYRVAGLKRKNELLDQVVNDRTREVQIKNEEISAQNEEIVAQNEELKLQSDLLEEKNSLLQQRQQELIELSTDLENRVDERTKDIQLLNKDLMDRNMQLEQFSFIVAHNFNGPVARLRGLFNLFPKDIVDDLVASDIFRDLKITIHDLEQVTVDVNRVLVIKRESNDFFELVDLREIIEKTTVQLADEIEKKNAIVDLSEFQSATMKGSRAYLQTIFFNLLQNSLKFSKARGTCEIKITCGGEGDLVKLEFIDNGIGIDMKLAWNKIFRLYQRFAFEASGRGFGLFLVKAQVEQMKGEISVASSVGKGTKFTVTFPAASATDGID